MPAMPCDYVLAKVPEVDPARIYAAGHSSAATHALLLAEHEPRLAGVIAYAPAIDVPKRFGPLLPIFRFLLPGLVDFVTQSSPHTHDRRAEMQARVPVSCRGRLELPDRRHASFRRQAEGSKEPT